MNSQILLQSRNDRRGFIGGSDARVIMGDDEGKLVRLWREKRGEVEPEDLSDNLIVQLGTVTEDLNRRWYERNTGHAIKDVQRRVQHPVIKWMAATLNGLVDPGGAVFEAKFMLPWTFSEEAAAEKHLAQLQHNMWISDSRSAVLSIITGGGKWVELTIQADPLYQHLLLTAEKRASAALRDQLIAEIGDLKNDDDLALWAHRRLPAKNTLTTGDAGVVEEAYRTVLDASGSEIVDDLSEPGRDWLPSAPVEAGSANTAVDNEKPSARRFVTPLRKSIRARNKSHLIFVAAQPCLICQRFPCDAHHLKFAQLRSLGRKVSDEFTVPLCRDHHQELHRHRNEAAWWANLGISPLQTANELWTATLRREGTPFTDSAPAPVNGSEMRRNDQA